MGIATALVVAGCLIAVALAGAGGFYAGIWLHRTFEREYAARVGAACYAAAEKARREALEAKEKVQRVIQSDMPLDKYEAEARKQTFEESIAPLFPKDNQIQKARKEAEKLKEMLGEP